MDDLIFPCPEALDPYSECFPECQKIIGSKKIIYILTGIAKPIYGEDKILSIPQTSANRLKMVYVGHHNQVNGYDRLSRVIPPLLDSLNGSILVAGRPGPLFAPSYPHWHEFGWTPIAPGLVDVLLLRNTRTYFDLTALEAMTLGIPILASRTG